jgi:hypothetical protein
MITTAVSSLLVIHDTWLNPIFGNNILQMAAYGTRGSPV